MKLYFAAPLFSEAERRFNLDLAKRLEETGIDVFLPQRDGVESNRPPYDQMCRDQRRRLMFEMDRDQIIHSDIFLFVLDGRVPDEGACVELGMAYSNRAIAGSPKHILGLQTDIRAAFIQSKLNPMVRLCFDQIVETREALIEVVHNLKKR